jgi:hypothetical protein
MAEGIPEYDELKLRVEPAESGTYRLLAFGPHDSAATETFALPFSELELENFILSVGVARRGTRSYRSPQMESAKRFGSQLCDALVKGPVRDVYVNARKAADEHQRGLRVTLYLTNVPELMGVPWEFLYEQRSFLSQSIYTPVVRSLDLTDTREPRKVTLPLRILGVVSSPRGFQALDVHGERAKLEAAVAPLRSQGLIDLAWVESATMEAVERAIGDPREEHVFHYIGHGAYDERTASGILVFEDADGGAREVTGEELCTLLGDERSLRLAVLNSCEGARSGRVDPFSGVASSFVACGIPAVIGMQFEITDQAAKTFSERLYTALAQGFPVDAALAQARKAIFAAGNDIEFGTPVLFLRGAATKLFEVEESKELPRRDAGLVLGESDFVVRLEQRGNGAPSGTEAAWQLTIENTGACRLTDVVARRPDGDPLFEPVELEIGQRHVVRWREAIEADGRQLITVSAADPSGSRISEQVSIHAKTEDGAPTGALDVVVPSQPRVPEAPERSAEENHKLFEEHAGEFENKFHPGQKAKLLEAIEGGETLLGMCRCSEPGAVARFVAVLFTSRRLIWCRQAPMSSATAGIVNWRDVRSVENRVPAGLKLGLADGTTFSLTGFKGTGVHLEDDSIEFTPHALRVRICALAGIADAGEGPPAVPQGWMVEVTSATSTSRALRVRLSRDTHIVKYKIGLFQDTLELDGTAVAKGSEKGAESSERRIDFEVSDGERILPARLMIEQSDLSLIKRLSLRVDDHSLYEE